MPSVASSHASSKRLERLGVVFPILILLAISLLVIPIPTVLMDLLLVGNMTAAVMILLTAIHVRRPLDFNVFPVLLLGTTLTRLVLNIASTRLILSNGADSGPDAAGRMIRSFGDFVAGGNLAIGLVIFLILIIIQFLVITRGASRISEVAARFTLDGLPGKQLAIDADLNAGLIDQEEAQRRREELSQQADFYGAMDGAGKFVTGDALAGMAITGVNILGGLYIGLVQNSMGIAEAAEIFTTLTIGDGLVSQIPAFLIALATGFLITRSSSSSNLSHETTSQLLQSPAALNYSGILLGGLAFTGLPMIPLLCLSAGCLLMANYVRTPLPEESEEENTAPVAASESGTNGTDSQPDLLERLQIEPLELLLGLGLLKLTKKEHGDLLQSLTNLRQQIAEELGMIVPSVRIRDDLTLDRNEYRIRIKGVEFARGTAFPDGFLALETPQTTRQIPGVELQISSDLLRAKWVESRQAETARSYGYRVVEPSTAVMIHFAEVVREHAAELLTRQQVHELLDRLKQTAPRMVEELVPSVVNTVKIHQVMTLLLEERVPVRDLETILQTIGDHSPRVHQSAQLTEYVRRRLSGTISGQYRDDRRRLTVLELEVGLEDELSKIVCWEDRGPCLRIPRHLEQSLLLDLEECVSQMITDGFSPVLMCDAELRPALKRLTRARLPRLGVIARQEISRDTEIQIYRQIKNEIAGSHTDPPMVTTNTVT
ncbi:MAG: FHIPEP family type III secretion protein [Planctomycetaceae bacterium]|nr:FHIPEP family type III secretion protein [Planctomycetaceae bacterium]